MVQKQKLQLLTFVFAPFFIKEIIVVHHIDARPYGGRFIKSISCK